MLRTSVMSAVIAAASIGGGIATSTSAAQASPITSLTQLAEAVNSLPPAQRSLAWAFLRTNAYNKSVGLPWVDASGVWHNVPVHHAASTTVPSSPAVHAASVSSASSSPGGVWACIRQHESGGNYATNTGNGYYGAYQFSQSTWRGLGYSGNPATASSATQDAAAQKLQAQSGWSPWPVTSKACGA